MTMAQGGQVFRQEHVDEATMRIENQDAVAGSGFVQYPPQQRFKDVKFQPLTHVQEPAPVVSERRPSAGGNSTNWKADKAVWSAAKSQQPRQHGRGGQPQANYNMQQGMYGQQQGYPQQGYPQHQQGYYQQQQQQGYYQQQQLQQQQGYYQQQQGYPQGQQAPGRASNGGHAPAPRRADNPLGKHAPQ